MANKEQKPGFGEIIKDIFGNVIQNMMANIFAPITQGAETIMNNLEERIKRIEKRIVRKIYSLVMILFGGILLVLALLSFLKEFLGWSSTASLFSIGIVIFVIGLLLKIGEPSA